MSDHMKRLAMPRTWAVPKKTHVWAAKQRPGAHSVEESIPAGMLLRDMLGVVDTAKEAKRMIADRDLLVNGEKIKDAKTPVGIMDTVSIPKLGQNYRILLTDKGKLTAVPISEEDAKWSLFRVEGKTRVSGGKLQLNLSSGRNILIPENKYKTGDTLKMTFADNEVLEVYPYDVNAVVLVINGRHAGKVETIESIKDGSATADATVLFQSKTETVKDNVFVIGSGKAEIALPEASE